MYILLTQLTYTFYWGFRMVYLIKTINHFLSTFKSDEGGERSIVNQLFVELLTPALPSYEYGILLLRVGAIII